MNESSHCSADTTTGVAFEIAIENAKLEYCRLVGFSGKKTPNFVCLPSRGYTRFCMYRVCARKRGALSTTVGEDRGWSDRYGRLPFPRKRMSRKKGRNNVRVFLFSCSTTHNNKKKKKKDYSYSDAATLAHHTVVPLWIGRHVVSMPLQEKLFSLFFPRNSHKFFPFFLAPLTINRKRS